MKRGHRFLAAAVQFVCVQPTDYCVTTHEAGSGSRLQNVELSGETYAVAGDNE
jgi:hypothetical protein